MSNATAVIGISFGDEGKGLMTDYFASKFEDTIVVRFNGGAQAYHTVITPDKKRHVFSHFGSGGFLNVETFLSRFFIVNPIIFCKELQEFDQFKINPRVFVDDSCIVTTPFDILINQTVENLRGDKKHGSVGVGINETIQRSLLSEKIKITVRDLYHPNILEAKLNLIRDYYIPLRLTELDILNKVDPVFWTIINNKMLLKDFMNHIRTFLHNIELMDERILYQYENVIFEGSQGVLLDEFSEFFPHVTRSRTGMDNVNSILDKNYEIENLEVVFVSRIYGTRHGNGPLPYEKTRLEFADVYDPTNKFHEFQGKLRVGLLDYDRIVKSIKKEIDKSCPIAVKYSISITCVDQLKNGKTIAMIDNKEVELSVEELCQKFRSDLPLHRIFISSGPTRETIVERTL